MIIIKKACKDKVFFLYLQIFFVFFAEKGAFDKYLCICVKCSILFLSKSSTEEEMDVGAGLGLIMLGSPSRLINRFADFGIKG